MVFTHPRENRHFARTYRPPVAQGGVLEDPIERLDDRRVPVRVDVDSASSLGKVFAAVT